MNGGDDLDRLDAQLLDALVDELEPVRPVARLRVRLAGVLAVGGGLFLAAIGVAGIRPDFVENLGVRPDFLATWLGLIGLVLGGTLTSLAAATPGRAAAYRRGRAVALFSLLGAMVACAVVAATGGFARESSLAVDLMCLRQSLILGALPSFAILGATLWGWVERPRAAAIAALASGTGFGALMVHLACGGDGAIHLLAGHLSVPVVASLALGFPLAAALKRWGR